MSALLCTLLCSMLATLAYRKISHAAAHRPRLSEAHINAGVDLALNSPAWVCAGAARMQGSAMTPDDTAHRDMGLGVLATEKGKLADEERSMPVVSAIGT